LQAKVKAKEIRGKKKEEVLKQLEELKNVSIPSIVLFP
jgi:ribosomal protein L29